MAHNYRLPFPSHSLINDTLHYATFDQALTCCSTWQKCFYGETQHQACLSSVQFAWLITNLLVFNGRGNFMSTLAYPLACILHLARTLHAWCFKFLQTWNARAIIPDPYCSRSPDLALFTDASGTLGYAVYYAGHWIAESLPAILQPWQQYPTHSGEVEVGAH